MGRLHVANCTLQQVVFSLFSSCPPCLGFPLLSITCPSQPAPPLKNLAAVMDQQLQGSVGPLGAVPIPFPGDTDLFNASMENASIPENASNPENTPIPTARTQRYQRRAQRQPQGHAVRAPIARRVRPAIVHTPAESESQSTRESSTAQLFPGLSHHSCKSTLLPQIYLLIAAKVSHRQILPSDLAIRAHHVRIDQLIYACPSPDLTCATTSR